MKSKHPMLVVLGFCAADAVRAEQLIDLSFALNNRKQRENPILLVVAMDCHKELATKVQIAAEVAFASVDLITVNAASEPADKTISTNRLFRSAAQAVLQEFRLPWIWLEPDCVPLCDDWLEQIAKAYYSQPKRFFGPHMKFRVGDDEKMCLGRVACYPQNAFSDLSAYCESIAPFNQVANNVIVGRSTKGRMIQHLEVHSEEDAGKIRPDATLLHSDKLGIAMKKIRATLTAS